jgi:DNA anti-recombination protein RmuC
VTGGLDQSVENLRALCELLRATNPVLESGVADLARVASSVTEGESRLSTDLDHLAADLDAAQKQAETSEADAVKACTELDHAADEVIANSLTEIGTDAAAAQAHWTSALHEKEGALDSAFQELESDGWDPLVATLTNEQADFERWMHSADEALTGLVLGLDTVATGVTQQGTVLDEAARDLEAAPPLSEEYWQITHDDAKKIVEETIPEFGRSVDRRSVDLNEVHEQVLTAVDNSSNQLRAQLDLTTETAMNAIEAQANAMTKAADEAEAAVRSAQTQYELSAVHGEEAGREAAQLLELAGLVVDAQAQLAKIREVLEALQ